MDVSLKVIGVMVDGMGTERPHLAMVMPTMVNTSLINVMARVSIGGPMAESLMDSSVRISAMGTEYSLGPMVQCMMVNLSMDNAKVMENTNLLTAGNTLAPSMVAVILDLVLALGKMADATVENGAT